MQHAATALTIVGLAASVAAGQFIGASVANPTLSPGETTTLTLTAGYADPDYAIAGIATSLVVDRSEVDLSDPRLVAPMDGPGTSAGVIVADGIDGILAGQLNFPTAGIYADPTNPIAFWQIDLTLVDTPTSPVFLSATTETTRFDVYIDMGSAMSVSRLDDLQEADILVALLPSPGTAAMLGLGGLLACRRRR
ncbi:MAG: hypothetical protein AAFX79_07770 [Planctomycetota bacterium]